MWYRICLVDALLALALVVTTLIGVRIATRSPVFGSPVEALNRCIQERFLDIQNFGIRRIATHLYEFNPETSDEKDAVAKLKQQGWTVGLYVVGRRLMDQPKDKSTGGETDPDRSDRAIRGPIRIAGEPTPTDLPGLSELREIGRSALVVSTSSDQYRAPIGRWSVDARPVRANQEACLKCHEARRATGDPPYHAGKPKLKIGDAIGVVLYVYNRTPK